MSVTRFQLRVRQVHQPNDRRQESSAQQGLHRRAHHVVCRSLHSVFALRAFHSRNQRQGQANSKPDAGAWETILANLRRELTEAARPDPGKVGFVPSPFLTCEEAYLLAKYAKSLSEKVRLFLGWVPVVGEDDRYPK